MPGRDAAYWRLFCVLRRKERRNTMKLKMAQLTLAFAIVAVVVTLAMAVAALETAAVDYVSLLRGVTWEHKASFFASMTIINLLVPVLRRYF